MALTKVSPDLLDLDAGITITTTDNSDNLTLTSTDADASVGPNLVLYRNSSSPADNDLLGQIKIVGRNDNSQDVDAVYIQNYMTDVSDGSEDAASFFYLMEGGAARERVGFSSTATVFNEDSRDVDFRVESDGNANMLYVDGGKNSVGIGIEPEAHYTGYVGLDIGAVASLFSNASGTNITTLTNNGFLNSDASNWVYKVTDEASMYSQVHGDHRFSTAASGSADAAITWSEKIRFQAAGGISFNGDTAAANALDDYEEGTFTPGFGGATLSTATGKYTKIGNQVTVYYHIVTTGGLPTSSAQAQISGLPFTIDSNGAGAIYARFYTPNDSTLTTILVDGDTVVRLINTNDSDFDYTTYGELEASHNNSVDIRGTATYLSLIHISEPTRPY